MKHLEKCLSRIRGKGYKAYKQLVGSYRFEHFTLSVDHVQGDPFALPSRISLRVAATEHGLPKVLWAGRVRQTALEDFLGQALARAIRKHVKGARGTGKSGQILIAANGQQVLRRNAVLIDKGDIEARLLFALPADGRSVRVDDARVMFFEELPRLVEKALLWRGRDLTDHVRQVELAEDQEFLRAWLPTRGAVAFVADGAILPRRSGIDDRPFAEGIPFQSPHELRASLTLPNRGDTSGMLIPAGVTLVVGGGFHGKSTLLQALEYGVYNHRPDDGRELVVTLPTAVKIRAEDHRAIYHVDISPFVGTLPGNRSTADFSSANASGSTSQAANIIEALECGADCLLIDEDTAATNFMIRDERMQQLVSNDQEPITPLLHRVRELYEDEGVSAVIVTGGSGDYLTAADRVILMDNYRPTDVTEQARLVGGSLKLPEVRKGSLRPQTIKPFEAKRFDARRSDGKVQIVVREDSLLDYGRHRIDLSRVEQLVDRGQIETIGRLLDYAAENYPAHPDGQLGALRQALIDAEKEGLDILFPWKVGHLAFPRLYELLAAANRLRD